MAYFVIIGKDDKALFEKEVIKMKKEEETNNFKLFMIHSSIDLLEELKWQSNNQFYFKNIENISKYLISGYVTPGCCKFLLLHENKNEESIKSFFNEVSEIVMKYQLNPFYELNSIFEKNFIDKIMILSNKWLK